VGNSFLAGDNHGKRKQKEIHIEAKTEGVEDRERLQETRRQQQRSGTPRVGHSQ
jgi:hypothetical protein